MTRLFCDLRSLRSMYPGFDMPFLSNMSLYLSYRSILGTGSKNFGLKWEFLPYLAIRVIGLRVLKNRQRSRWIDGSCQPLVGVGAMGLG